jgi:type I restriction enzyme, S subunit
MSIAKFNVPLKWEQTSLKNIAKIKSGSTPLRAQHERYFVDGQIPWIKTMDLTNEKISQTDECITDLAVKETSCPILQPDTVLVAMYGGFNQIGRTGIMTFTGSINQAISSLSVDEAMAIPDYVLYWLNANVDLWRRFAASSRKDPNITKKDVEDFPILLPPLPEQRKIAEILSTWDEAIAASERLLASLRQRKKGLMQRLLTGQVRFAGFEGEWRETTIGDIFTLGRGRVISNQYINEHPGSYPVYSSQSKNKGMMGAIDSYDFEGKYITWTTDGAYAGTVFYRNGKFNCTNVCGTMKPKSKDVDLRFVAYQISRITKRYVSYVGNPKLMNNIMAIVPVQLPSYEEQKKIGDILQFADDEIELLEQKLEALQQQKKGLMQRLLTGQVRVRI